MKSTLAALVAAYCVAIFPGVASAQSDADKATARALFVEAQQALSAKDYAKAADSFGRSDAMVHAPTAALGFARAQAGLGRLVGAYESYNRIVREGAPAGASPAFVAAVNDAKGEIAALKARLPTVKITVSGPPQETVSVFVDGGPIPAAALGVNRFIDPGTHKLGASARGYLPKEMELNALEGGTATAEIVLQRDPKFPALGGGDAAVPPEGARPTEPPLDNAAKSAAQRRTVGFVVGGVGVAGLGVAGITGAFYLAQKSTAEQHCTAQKQCDQQGLDAASSAKTLGVVNTLAFVGGLAAVGVGVYLVVSSKPGAGRAQTALLVAPDGAGGRLSLVGGF